MVVINGDEALKEEKQAYKVVSQEFNIVVKLVKVCETCKSVVKVNRMLIKKEEADLRDKDEPSNEEIMFL